MGGDGESGRVLPRNPTRSLETLLREQNESPQPPRPFPSPGERSCSPSRSSGSPADWSAGTSTAGDTSEHLSSTQRQEERRCDSAATPYLQLKCVYLLILTEVPFAFVLHHLAVRLAGHQPMHVVIWKPTEKRESLVLFFALSVISKLN